MMMMAMTTTIMKMQIWKLQIFQHIQAKLAWESPSRQQEFLPQWRAGWFGLPSVPWAERCWRNTPLVGGGGGGGAGDFDSTASGSTPARNNNKHINEWTKNKQRRRKTRENKLSFQVYYPWSEQKQLIIPASSKPLNSTWDRFTTFMGDILCCF